jgi:hypothetical protein
MALVTSLISGPALRRLLRKPPESGTPQRPVLEAANSSFKG